MKNSNGAGGEGSAGSGTPELLTPAPGAARPRLDHLTENRRLIVRRSLLATAVGGAIPLPVLSDYFAGRVRAGMLIKLGERRQVDLAPSSADLLGDPREATAVGQGTRTVLALWALKRAWRKVFTLMAIGRLGEEMATTFQLGILFDHYCAKLHVGGEIDRRQAVLLRGAIHGAFAESERSALVTAFREGSQVLGRSALEAPAWMSARIERAARRWAESGGRTADPGDGDVAEGDEEARWLDRASAAVEERLTHLGQTYLDGLVGAFERRLKAAAEAARQSAAAEKPPESG